MDVWFYVIAGLMGLALIALLVWLFPALRRGRVRGRPRVIDAERLTREEVSLLATYNSEVARGLMHTEQWASEMAALQSRFDATVASALRLDRQELR